ncbi:hypothetical protein C8R44DRAFT_738141 [Mycena epipterygia]|nr:hypothetical protein C8R44DRAFT_738141 [Mycena epipterygia]
MAAEEKSYLEVRSHVRDQPAPNKGPVATMEDHRAAICLATTTGNSPDFRVSGLDPTGARVKSIHQGREKCLRQIRSVSTTSGHRQARHAWLELSSLMATKCMNGNLRKDTVTQQRGTPTGPLTAEHAEITMVDGKVPPGCALRTHPNFWVFSPVQVDVKVDVVARGFQHRCAWSLWVALGWARSFRILNMS